MKFDQKIGRICRRCCGNRSVDGFELLEQRVVFRRPLLHLGRLKLAYERRSFRHERAEILMCLIGHRYSTAPTGAAVKSESTFLSRVPFQDQLVPARPALSAAPMDWRREATGAIILRMQKNGEMSQCNRIWMKS